jgi:AcrR family transcriptional regulator
MPRARDARTEGRILEAAFRLWTKGGERALTMRAVAGAAGTTTPTVYARFRDKRDILRQLRAHALEDLVQALEKAESAAGTCRVFLDFAAAHPNEYRLMVVDWAARLSRKEPKPTFELIKGRLARELGGEPSDHVRLALALGEVLHGTATMLLTEDVHAKVARELRQACLTACEALIECARAGPGRWGSEASSPEEG